MAHPSGPADPKPADDPRIDAGRLLGDQPPLSASEIVPIGPNLFATFASFVALLAAPWISQQILLGLWDDAIGEDPVATLFVLANLEESFLIAAAGAAFFLVVGVILQAWWHQRPYSVRWPVVLAFPIALGLIVPESLMRGGSLISGVVVGLAVALVFVVHWRVLVHLSETMD
jgi:hypothetical protein